MKHIFQIGRIFDGFGTYLCPFAIILYTGSWLEDYRTRFAGHVICNIRMLLLVSLNAARNVWHCCCICGFFNGTN